MSERRVDDEQAITAITVGPALDCYKQEFTNYKENYYSESGAVKARGYGCLADKWNLKESCLLAVCATNYRSRSAYT